MPIVLKKKDGQVKELPRVSAEKPPPQAATIPASASVAEAWAIVKDKTYDLFCSRLEKTAPEDIDTRAEVAVAYWLGLGSPEARRALEMDNTVTAEWPRLLPWFAQPYVGEQLLPPDATWEIHRIEVEGGMGGYATVKIGEHVIQSTARTPWAAFAVCLIRAGQQGLVKK